MYVFIIVSALLLLGEIKMYAYTIRRSVSYRISTNNTGSSLNVGRRFMHAVHTMVRIARQLTSGHSPIHAVAAPGL